MSMNGVGDNELGASREKGSSMVEATLVLLFLCALIFLVIDLSWAEFAKVTLQHAVRAGCRYAITGQTTTGAGGAQLGQTASIKQVVQHESMGFLTDANMAGNVFVRFYVPGTNPPVLATGDGSNAGGNLVVVSVENYTVDSFGPLLRSGTPVAITVRAGDLIESSSIAAPPPL